MENKIYNPKLLSEKKAQNLNKKLEKYYSYPESYIAIFVQVTFCPFFPVNSAHVPSFNPDNIIFIRT